MRTIGWMLFFFAVSGLDALRDATYVPPNWARVPFLWSDGFHFIKWGAFYGPLVVILWHVWPLWIGNFGIVRWYNIPRWLAAAAVGWASWWVFARVGGAPWLQ